jgi:hypothetical protein
MAMNIITNGLPANLEDFEKESGLSIEQTAETISDQYKSEFFGIPALVTRIIHGPQNVRTAYENLKMIEVVKNLGFPLFQFGPSSLVTIIFNLTAARKFLSC